ESHEPGQARKRAAISAFLSVPEGCLVGAGGLPADEIGVVEDGCTALNTSRNMSTVESLGEILRGSRRLARRRSSASGDSGRDQEDRPAVGDGRSGDAPPEPDEGAQKPLVKGEAEHG